MFRKHTATVIVLAGVVAAGITTVSSWITTVNARRASPVSSFQQPPATTKKQQLEAVRAILNTSDLWGKDFKAVLATVPSFEDTGEQQLLIFPDKVIGANKISLGAPATQRNLRRLNRSIVENQNKMIVSKDTKAEAFLFEEDNARHVALTSETSEYLAPNAKISDVQQRFGKPERISKHSIQSSKQDRPETLIYFHYAGDAIIFVSSNIKNYGYLDRVILDAPVIKAAMKN
jgi:hypothetical protein